MSLEISRQTRNGASPDSTLRAGEPMSERLTPSDFHIYQASLERLGVPTKDARMKAAILRLSHCRTSKKRQEMLAQATNGNNDHSAIIAAEHRLDSIAVDAFRSSLQAIDPLRRKPVAIPIAIDNAVVFEINK